MAKNENCLVAQLQEEKKKYVLQHFHVWATKTEYCSISTSLQPRCAEHDKCKVANKAELRKWSHYGPWLLQWCQIPTGRHFWFASNSWVKIESGYLAKTAKIWFECKDIVDFDEKNSNIASRQQKNRKRRSCKRLCLCLQINYWQINLNLLTTCWKTMHFVFASWLNWFFCKILLNTTKMRIIQGSLFWNWHAVLCDADQDSDVWNFKQIFLIFLTAQDSKSSRVLISLQTKVVKIQDGSAMKQNLCTEMHHQHSVIIIWVPLFSCCNCYFFMCVFIFLRLVGRKHCKHAISVAV